VQGGCGQLRARSLEWQPIALPRASALGA
jgi:hypothetical protein